jgi:hypothetical protein
MLLEACSPVAAPRCESTSLKGVQRFRTFGQAEPACGCGNPYQNPGNSKCGIIFGFRAHPDPASIIGGLFDEENFL